MARTNIQEIDTVFRKVLFNFDYDALEIEAVIQSQPDDRSLTERKLERRDKKNVLPSGLTRKQERLLRG